MNIDIEKIPFSCPGAYLAIQKSPIAQGDGIWLRSLIRPEWGTGRPKVSDRMVRLIPTDSSGAFVAYKTHCTPECLRFASDFGHMEISFTSARSVRIVAKNMGIVFEHDSDDSHLVNIETSDTAARGYFPVTFFDLSIRVDKGALRYARPQRRFFITGEDIAVSVEAAHRFADIDGAPITKESLKESFAAFRAVYKPSCETEETALYLLWSGTYGKAGRLTRPATAVSKGLMNNVWSWDNCFNALALAPADPRLAADNLLLFFDLQLPDGRLPDAVNPYITVDWFTKPPIYGHFVTALMDRGVLTDEDLTCLYPRLCRLIGYWESTACANGLFAYAHPFDSGWDNATCFDGGTPLCTPDLNAYMVLLYRAAGRVAERIGRDGKAHYAAGDALLKRMLDTMYADGKFLCVRPDGMSFVTTSLIRLVPAFLGDLLPDEVMASLARELAKENLFLTENSLATESLDSPLYDSRRTEGNKPNAYWRGPVWAPPVYCISAGLRSAGYDKLADKIAGRFTALVERDKRGIYENYDALSGAGYDDSSYMWTASVYILLKTVEKENV